MRVYWTPQEEKLLRQVWGTKHILHIQTLFPNRSWLALRHKASKMRLNRVDFYNSVLRFKEHKRPKPSKKFAWFLGVLAGDGWITTYKKGNGQSIGLSSKDFKFLEEFRKVGEELFGIPAAKVTKRRRTSNSAIQYESKFYSNNLSQYLGDWRGDIKLKWVATLRNDYHWIFEKREYTVGFLEGFFDSEGTARKPKSKCGTIYKFSFAVTPKKAKKVITEMLGVLGIKTCETKGDIHILSEYRPRFAKLIHSSIPRKEIHLAAQRHLSSNFHKY